MEESYWVFIEGTKNQTKKQQQQQNSSSMMNLLLICKGRYTGMYAEVYSWIFFFFLL